MEIIKSDKLATYIATFIKEYKASGRKAHVAIVSALAHVCEHNNTTPLNDIYDALRSNDQQAMRLYIRRVFAIMGLDGDLPDGKSADVVQAAVERGAIVSFSKGKFSPTKDPSSAESQALFKALTERFINPDGEKDRYALARNNFAEVRTLGDRDYLKKVIKLVNEMSTDTDTRKSDVTDPVLALMSEFKDKSQAMLDQLGPETVADNSNVAAA